LTRVKRALKYIEDLRLSSYEAKRDIGELLETLYYRWIKTLSLKDFLEFNETIKLNKDLIGAAQFFGKFRAYAFEEYIYRLIKRRVNVPISLKIFWGEKCVVWRKLEKFYAVEFDVSIGLKEENYVDPKIVFDAKVELDSSRLKTALASFILLKDWKPEAKCIIVYVDRELDEALLCLAKNRVDGIFQLSLKNNETEAFLNFLSACLS
jgi:hypothetical protein